MSTRVLAARALKHVIYDGQSLTEVLQWERIQQLEVRDQALLRDICFGCLRWHQRLSAILKLRLSKAFKAADKDVECLLRTGLYQLIYQRTPDHAAVNECVNASKGLKKPWARGVLNGVLRGFLRDRDEVLDKIDQQVTARYAFPLWLIKALQEAYPQDWQRICEQSNTHPPFTLRVNELQYTRVQYQRLLEQADLAYTPHPHVDAGLQLQQAQPVSSLPEFMSGAVSVQDAAAQLAAQLLDAGSGDYVLDACAAPGGKTCHILTRAPDAKVLALDISESRLQQVHENLARLKLSCEVLAADAADIEHWWDGQVFDRILLDAPCSATGVIRRHPDIKCLRKSDDITKLQQLQAQLLDKMWKTLKSGGHLLYATCSVLPQENNQQIERFLAEHADALHKPIEAEWGRACTVGRQILPGDDGMDGFYYALLQKQ